MFKGNLKYLCCWLFDGDVLEMETEKEEEMTCPILLAYFQFPTPHSADQAAFTFTTQLQQ